MTDSIVDLALSTPLTVTLHDGTIIKGQVHRKWHHNAENGFDPQAELSVRTHESKEVRVRQDQIKTIATRPVYWSAVRGTSPEARAVEPAPAGVDVPDDVLEWAARRGLSPEDPDVYLLVTPAEESGTIDGEIDYIQGHVTEADIKLIRAAL